MIHKLITGECITHDDITIHVISHDSYQLHRLDRNRHGGRVIVYVHSNYVTTLIPVSSDSLEILSLSVSNV